MEYSCEIISKSDLRFQRRFLKHSISLLRQQEFLIESEFCVQLLERTSQGTFLPSLVQIGPAVLGGENV